MFCFLTVLAPSTLVLLPKWDINVALEAIPKFVHLFSSAMFFPAFTLLSTLVLLPEMGCGFRGHSHVCRFFCLRNFFLSAFTLPSFVTDETFYRHRYKISSLTLVPSVVHQLINHPDIQKVDLSSILHIGSGAAYFSPELRQKLVSLVPKDTSFAEGSFSFS